MQSVLLGCIIVWAGAEPAPAQPAKSDSAVLARIFRESFLSQNVRPIHRRAMQLEAAERLEFLRNRILPTPDRPTFRLGGWFETSSAPRTLPVADDKEIDTGITITSPAIDLVEAARESGQLDKLQAELLSLQATYESEDSQRAAVALHVLIEIARERFDAVGPHVDTFFARLEASNGRPDNERWPEILVVNALSSRPQFRKATADLLAGIKFDSSYGKATPWRRNIQALKSRSRVDNSRELSSGQVEPVTRWKPAARFDAVSLGNGHPVSEWHISRHGVRNVTGHGIDLLYYQLPLRGNYEVECDVSSLSYANGHLMVAGTWLAVAANSSQPGFASGSYRTQYDKTNFEKKLPKTDAWSRYRVVVRDGTRRTYFNGKLIDTRQLAEDHDPWLAIRDQWNQYCAVRDVRITGSPTIPRSIDLLSNDLEDWYPYLSESDWDTETSLFGFGSQKLIGHPIAPIASGASVESMLYYHRPMFEDGTVEYDFFYQPGKTLVHPAIGRTAFLLDSDTVKRHRLTYGIHESEPQLPNATIDARASQHPASLPLKPDEWNRMQLNLVGDEVELVLNDSSVFKWRLDPADSRNFGLFHFADQTKALVRRISYSGAWPRALPALTEQELTLPDHECLAGLEGLQEVQTIQLGQPQPESVLSFNGRAHRSMTSYEAGGMRVTPRSVSNYQEVRMHLGQPIYGDFDAQLTFAELRLEHKSKGPCGVGLLAVDDVGRRMGTFRQANSDNKQNAVSKFSFVMASGERQYRARRLSDQSEDGTFRLIRRGRFVHKLIAGSDSSHYRYIGRDELPSAMVPVSLDFMANTTGRGIASVLLKELRIRSNSSRNFQNRDANVIALEGYSSALRNRFEHQFAKRGPEGFVTASGESQVTEEGLRMAAKAEDAASSLVRFKNRALGDFDVAVSLSDINLPVGGKNAITFLATSTTSNAYAAAVVTRTPDNQFRIAAVARGGRSVTTAGDVQLESLDGLRLVRVQDTVFFLYSEGGIHRMFAQFDSAPGFGATPCSIELAAQATDKEVDVTWQTFDLRAVGIDG